MTQPINRLLARFTPLALLFLSAVAQAAPMPHPQRAGVLQEPVQVVTQGLHTLLAISRSAPSQDQLLGQLRAEISPYFDFDYMARWVGGPLWRQLSPAQRAQLGAQLQTRFLGGLAEKLAVGQGTQSFRLLAPQGNPRSGEVRVSVLVAQGQGRPPQKISFRLYRGTQGWKAFDVLANGSSAVAYYRQQFRDQLRPRRY